MNLQYMEKRACFLWKKPKARWISTTNMYNWIHLFKPFIPLTKDASYITYWALKTNQKHNIPFYIHMAVNWCTIAKRLLIEIRTEMCRQFQYSHISIAENAQPNIYAEGVSFEHSFWMFQVEMNLTQHKYAKS